MSEVVESLGVVTLVADWSSPNEEIESILKKLGSKQIPVLAIFPAKNPNQPIVLRGIYTKADVIEKLREAGPSKGHETRLERHAARTQPVVSHSSR